MPYADPTAQRQANTAAQRRRRARHRAQVVDATEAASPSAPDALAAATVPSDVPGLCEATLRQAAVFIANPDSPQSLAAALRAAAPEPLPDPEPDFLAGATAEQLHRLSALFAEITVDSEDRARRTGERANPWPDRAGPKSAWAPCRVGDAFGLSAAAVAAVEAYEARPEIAGTSYRGPTAAPPASLLEAAQAVVRAYELRCELAARLQGGGFGFQAADGRYHGPGLLWREVDAGVPRAIHNLRRTLEAPEIA